VSVTDIPLPKMCGTQIGSLAILEMTVCVQKSGFPPLEYRKVDPEQQYRQSKDQMLIHKPVNILRYKTQFGVRAGKLIEWFSPGDKYKDSDPLQLLFDVDKDLLRDVLGES
jgi:hypothetical protein